MQKSEDLRPGSRRHDKINQQFMKRLSLLLFVLLLSVSSGIAQTERATQSSPRTTPVEVGESAPDFTLEDFRVENDQWRTVTLSAARGQAPVVLVFYRGHW